VVGELMEKIIPESSHALVREKYRQAIDSGAVVDYIEESLHPAGIKYGHIRVIPIRDSGQKVHQLLGIAHDITDKTLLEDALNQERVHKNRQITAAAIKGQELERSRVSRELHDNVNQVLTTVKLYTELCIDDRVSHKEVLPKCVQLLNSSITEIRSLSKQLSSPSLGGLNYRESITELIESVRQSSGLDIRLRLALGDCGEMDGELHLTVYRILQEQLTNIQKYAGASHICVVLKFEPGELVLQVDDDGSGFDTQKKYKGIGIANMQSRSQLLHGTFDLSSAVGQGTRLEVCFPVRVADGVCLPAYA
jgi:two-component system, NarL family, sensor kinase